MLPAGAAWRRCLVEGRSRRVAAQLDAALPATIAGRCHLQPSPTPRGRGKVDVSRVSLEVTLRGVCWDRSCTRCSCPGGIYCLLTI